MPNIAIILVVFAATFSGVWYFALPPPIIVTNAQSGYALDLRALWAISAKEAERQAAMGLSKALDRVDDNYGAAEFLYQTRQLIRQRADACLDGRVTAAGFTPASAATCTDRKGDDFQPYRRPFVFFKDGSHFSPPAGEPFEAPKQSPKTGAPLIRHLKAAVPRLRALDVKITTGAAQTKALSWSFRLHGSDWTDLEQAERQRLATSNAAPVVPVALVDQPVLEPGNTAGVCRTVRDAARIKGELNVPDSAIKLARACRYKSATGAELLAVSYHKTRQRIRSEQAPNDCAGLIRNILMLEGREGRPSPAIAACIGARFHEHDALDVDVNLFETVANGQLRYFAN